MTRYDGKSTSDGHVLLYDDNNPDIRKGLNQQNTIDVTAIGSTITLYTNKYKIDFGQDSSYPEGSIGLIASPKQQTTEVAYNEVAYNNARVWEFLSNKT